MHVHIEYTMYMYSGGGYVEREVRVGSGEVQNGSLGSGLAQSSLNGALSGEHVIRNINTQG